MGQADAFGDAVMPVLALNVVCPLVPEEIRGFCAGKRSVLVIEEGQPEFIEQEVLATLRRQDVDCRIHGKDLLPMAGEYTVEVIGRGLAEFFAREAPELPQDAGRNWLAETDARRQAVADELASPLPARPPQFCTGCPERPVFAALKLVQQDVGPVHIAADIGCHSFATLEPFSMGHSILGYGMSLASRAGVSPMFSRRTLAVMGDGGFWHNGLLSGVQSALFNGDDAVLLILKNGYTSATGTQEIISSPSEAQKADAGDPRKSAVHANRAIERTLAGIGVKWLREVDSYDVAAVRRTLDEAFTTDFAGLKVIIAEGECQLERQRRVKPWRAAMLKAGKRTVRVKYGVDEDTCSGDHSCIRLSGCPTLTLKASSDPLKVDPVATVIDGCVGCGLCGENAHAAALCPSFYRGEVIQNPQLARPARSRTASSIHWPIANGNDGDTTTDHDPDRRARWAGRRRARRMAGRGRAERRLPGAEHVDPRRRATHRRDDLLRRGLSRAVRGARWPPSGALAAAGSRRHRSAGRLGAARSRAHGAKRHGQPRPDGARDLVLPDADHGGKNGAGRRPLRSRSALRRGAAPQPAPGDVRHGRRGAGRGHGGELGHVRGDCRERRVAVRPRRVRRRRSRFGSPDRGEPRRLRARVGRDERAAGRRTAWTGGA